MTNRDNNRENNRGYYGAYNYNLQAFYPESVLYEKSARKSTFYHVVKSLLDIHQNNTSLTTAFNSISCPKNYSLTQWVFNKKDFSCIVSPTDIRTRHIKFKKLKLSFNFNEPQKQLNISPVLMLTYFSAHALFHHQSINKIIYKVNNHVNKININNVLIGYINPSAETFTAMMNNHKNLDLMLHVNKHLEKCENLTEIIKEIYDLLGKQSFQIWNSTMDKVIKFDRIGVLLVGKM